MNHTIIGTAGHVDHGKTQLIKALTGTDTDRLTEEKKRGITIELGFAYLTAPDGSKVGIIDVPGHEKFIKNMLMGAGSIDVAMLVVASDEGFMPQTREHLNILQLLGVERGLIALTKMDLVEEEWLEMVQLDIESEVEGTFLQGAPILPVSAVTTEGIGALKEALFALLAQSKQKELSIPFRLPVDRVFPVDGFGTVVTGTLTQGVLHVGDSLTLYPSLDTAKVRNLQVHGQDQPTVYAGQRVAVNVSGIKYTDIAKGDVLAADNSMKNSFFLDVSITSLPNTSREISNNSRLHLHIGSRELLCRISLLGQDVLHPGESGYAQLRLAQPVAARPEDRFVLRFYSPLETIAGGVVLDPSPPKHNPQEKTNLSSLSILATGSFKEQISEMVLRRSPSFPLLAEIKLQLFQANPLFDEAVSTLLQEGTLLSLGNESIVHHSYISLLGKKSQEIVNTYHQANPLKEGMPRDELWAKLLPGKEPLLADKVIELLVSKGYLRLSGHLVAHKDFSSTMSQQHQKITDELLSLFLSAEIETPDLDTIAQQYLKEKTVFKQSFDVLVDRGDLLVLTPKIAIHKDFYQKALLSFDQIEKEKGDVSLADFRDSL
ncbi:MAG: selenocysteine-specific translation elongation factor, partial [Clostridiales bacterium]|nr:selenocysteine-specific translation elongation factor [Clostridiales bacterium]